MMWDKEKLQAKLELGDAKIEDVTNDFDQEMAVKFNQFSPRLAGDRHQRKRSAVVMMLREVAGGDVEILMIERAQRAGDPWSGHMGFPGGRVDAGDVHSYAAALRECMEEIGLDLASHGCFMGRLS